MRRIKPSALILSLTSQTCSALRTKCATRWLCRRMSRRNDNACRSWSSDQTQERLKGCWSGFSAPIMTRAQINWPKCTSILPSPYFEFNALSSNSHPFFSTPTLFSAQAKMRKQVVPPLDEPPPDKPLGAGFALAGQTRGHLLRSFYLKI
ncbi:hypothetical protein IWZ01DRAFT_249881 [Phyllosticta capitalensis]